MSNNDYSPPGLQHGVYLLFCFWKNVSINNIICIQKKKSNCDVCVATAKHMCECVHVCTCGCELCDVCMCVCVKVCMCMCVWDVRIWDEMCVKENA